MKLSIIVPIYNVELYIKECIESIISQLEDEVEIICVNDGTLDLSMDIVRSIVEKKNEKVQSQFKIVDQSNQGLSAARNTGIDIASGDYIGFLDSDDKLMPNYISTILTFIKEGNYDLIDFNLMKSSNEEVSIYYNSEYSLKNLMRNGCWFACARVIKKSLLENLRFTIGIYYEDLCLIPMLYIKTKKIKYINECLYWYRVNPLGITLLMSYKANRKTIESFERILKIYLDEYERYHGNNKEILGVVIFQAYFLLCVNSCRRFSLRDSFHYVDLYKKVMYIYSVQKENVDLNKKLHIFLNFSKLYLFFYKTYCHVKYR